VEEAKEEEDDDAWDPMPYIQRLKAAALTFRENNLSQREPPEAAESSTRVPVGEVCLSACPPALTGRRASKAHEEGMSGNGCPRCCGHVAILRGGASMACVHASPRDMSCPHDTTCHVVSMACVHALLSGHLPMCAVWTAG
jgi:hypothetical protein